MHKNRTHTSGEYTHVCTVVVHHHVFYIKKKGTVVINIIIMLFLFLKKIFITQLKHGREERASSREAELSAHHPA